MRIVIDHRHAPRHDHIVPNSDAGVAHNMASAKITAIPDPHFGLWAVEVNAAADDRISPNLDATATACANLPPAHHGTLPDNNAARAPNEQPEQRIDECEQPSHHAAPTS